MQLTDVVEVDQVFGALNANKRLSEGWKLLGMVPGNSSTGGATVIYVFGKPAPEPKMASSLNVRFPS